MGTGPPPAANVAQQHEEQIQRLSVRQQRPRTKAPRPSRGDREVGEVRELKYLKVISYDRFNRALL